VTTTAPVKIKPPFPWFGGKSRVAHLIWSAFGTVDNYVEPFAGSLAVLLNAPYELKVSTVNDLDRYVANFWRAVTMDPAVVAKHADWPVNETDLEARHYWLVTKGRSALEAGMSDPDWFDAKIAGWWVWGQSCWIAGGWCSGKGPWVAGENGFEKRDGPGIGVNRTRPDLSRYGFGVNRPSHHGSMLEYISSVAKRLRPVRVCCGDWRRVLTKIPTTRHGITAIMLDPPYADTAGRAEDIYSTDSLSVAHDVRDWCIENQDNPLLRIALCGYEGEHKMPDTWRCVAWKSSGYNNTSNAKTRGDDNTAKERIWFSPHCVPVESGWELTP